MPYQKKKNQKDAHAPTQQQPSKKEKTPSQPSKNKSPPELLCDIEVNERPKVCGMLDSMIAKRTKLLSSSEPWNEEKCADTFKYIHKNLLQILLGENIFLPLEIQDIFQNLCDYREKMLELPEQKKEFSDQLRNSLSLLYLTKMKFMMIQIMDEIYKELFNMEMDMDNDDDEFGLGDEGESLEQRPGKDLYKKFKNSS